MRTTWIVEDAVHAYIPPGECTVNPGTGVVTAVVEIELAGQKEPAVSLMSIPAHCLEDGKTSPVGVLIAHGAQAPTYKGKLITQLANTLAAAGHVVMRYNSDGKEQRRQRMFEKALDAAATSPYARHVTRWVLLGIGSGGRIAAVVGPRCRPQVAGCVLLSYPLMEPASAARGPPAPDSSGPLLRLHAPMLVVQPVNAPLGSPQQVKEVLMKGPSWDVRFVEVEGVDGAFRDGATKAPPSTEMRARLSGLVVDYVKALATDTLPSCTSLPALKSGPPPPHIPPPTVAKAPLPIAVHHQLGQQLIACGLLPTLLMKGSLAGLQQGEPTPAGATVQQQQVQAGGRAGAEQGAAAEQPAGSTEVLAGAPAQESAAPAAAPVVGSSADVGAGSAAGGGGGDGGSAVGTEEPAAKRIKTEDAAAVPQGVAAEAGQGAATEAAGAEPPATS